MNFLGGGSSKPAEPDVEAGATLLSDWKSYSSGTGGASKTETPEPGSASPGGGSGLGSVLGGGLGGMSSMWGETTRGMSSLTAGMKDALKLDELQQAGTSAAGISAWGQSLANASVAATVNISNKVATDVTRVSARSAEATISGMKQGANVMQAGMHKAGSTVKKGALDSVATIQSFSHKRLLYFVTLFSMGVFFMVLAFVVGLPVIVIFPAKFAICFTLGSLFNMAAFAALKGPVAQMQHLMEWERLPFSAAYIGSMLGTLWASMIAHSYILSFVFCGAQMVALTYYMATYFPGGQAGMKAIMSIVSTALKPFFMLFGKCVGATTKCAMG